ncbi:MAG: LytR/AlgR family response regulator transcription factor [Myxococcota bacterium]
MTHPRLRAILADDEPLARAYLRELLDAHPDVQVLAECRNGLEAVRAIAEHKPDLAFLDIEMPKLDGFEVLELADPLPAVVFVTAYDQYAVRAFEAAAVDYLLKPFASERLAAALGRVRARVAARQVQVGQPAALPPDAGALRRQAFPDRPYVDRLAVKNGAEVVIVDVHELDCVTSEDDYVSLHVGKRTWLKHQSMASLEQSLDPRRFVRIHRTCLVHVERVAKVEAATRDTFEVWLRNGEVVPGTRAGVAKLRAVLGI